MMGSPKSLGLNSKSLDWERALITGHPTHPVRNLFEDSIAVNVPC